MKHLGRHGHANTGTVNSRLAKFRVLLRPGTALGVALVVLVLTAVGVLRVLTWSGDATATHAQGDNHVGNVMEADDETASMPQSDGEESVAQALGYGLNLSGDSAKVSTDEVVIHVTGAVTSPGVVRLSTGARILDAVEAAGGLTQEADIGAINLAAFAADGSQVHVPVVGEAPRAATSSSGTSSETTSSGISADGGCIDLNTASEVELEGLDGVGPKLAARIAQHRDSNGPFSSSSDLIAVSGIGPALSARIAEGSCQ